MPLRLRKYISTLRNTANRLERTDINGIVADSFLKRNQRRMICLSTSILITYNLESGFSSDFVSYVSSVLSILVGLFITALIFCFDKFYEPEKASTQDFELSIKKDGLTDNEKKYEINLSTITSNNSQKKIWDIQSYNYAKQFSFITGYNIVISIFSLILLSLSSLFEETMNFNLFNYHFDFVHINTTTITNLLIGTTVCIQRLLVLYWIGCVVYNTLFIVSSMVNFMTVKNDRTNV